MRKVTRRGVTLHTDASAAEVESADRAYSASGTQREQLDALLSEHSEGLIQHQCAELLGWNSRDNVNPRMQELKAMGRVYQPGERRETGLGGTAEVWRHSRFATTTGRPPRSMPPPTDLAASDREIQQHVKKLRGRAQSKAAPPQPSRPALTEEQREAKREEALRREEERIRATTDR